MSLLIPLCLYKDIYKWAYTNWFSVDSEWLWWPLMSHNGRPTYQLSHNGARPEPSEATRMGRRHAFVALPLVVVLHSLPGAACRGAGWGVNNGEQLTQLTAAAGGGLLPVFGQQRAMAAMAWRLGPSQGKNGKQRTIPSPNFGCSKPSKNHLKRSWNIPHTTTTYSC